jgi:hypothetical protein
MAHSTLDLENIWATRVVDRSVNVCTHGGEREQTVVLANFGHKTLSTAITVKME